MKKKQIKYDINKENNKYETINGKEILQQSNDMTKPSKLSNLHNLQSVNTS